MSELVLLLLRYLLLALLFLFLYRAVRVMQEELRGASGETSVPPATLAVEETEGRVRPGQVFVISGEAVIGRSPEVQVVLADEFTSHQHARLVVRGGRYWIEDLGSRNGTYLNGQRIEAPAPLADGDLVRIGSTTLRFRWPTWA
ncbi:MAG: FHA domain-containing protein [Armatimonadota bacterium]|nr:FHA domain-containing protein [Armatimonadota bacterium]MDR7439642.1 FHA domain-containing protein [Armatimonadota bacterium]MDR7563922.1 FHA domain-containing protein [Armatimonadota bacterium]MDR7566760.1 FHA domain-containing protein [Armatimonadota bacterium]MDR7601304.1 FHA domain-containing protein [Armatimonadota bacterium]